MDHVEHFVTYFDANYLPRGVALHRSLQMHATPFHLWVLCLDEESERLLAHLGLPYCTAVPLNELEGADDELRQTRPTRSRIEYYFTLTPALIRYLLDREGMDRLTYLDADLFFFSDPGDLFEESGGAPITVVEHRFPDQLHHLEVYGRFNVGWLTFRNVPDARACLDWWRDRTIEWCYDVVEENRFADQKYLDRWPGLFGDALHVLDHPGANVAPWNLGRHDLTETGEEVRVDGRRLVFFHFHGFRQIGPHTYDPNVRNYGQRISPALKHQVIAPYVEALERVRDELGEPAPLSGGVRRASTALSLRGIVVASWRCLVRPILRLASVARRTAVVVRPHR